MIFLRIEDFEHKYVATEWDHGWFCYKCDELNHWRTKAFVHNGKHYCRQCAERLCGNEGQK